MQSVLLPICISFIAGTDELLGRKATCTCQKYMPQACFLVMQPLEDNPVGLAQQQLCLQKMDLFYDSW